jgi:hypothetical protein
LEIVANYSCHNSCRFTYNVIPYRASTGPKQGFPCVVFPHRENPVFIAGFPVDENRFFPVGNTTHGNPCFHYRDGFAVYLKNSSGS